VTSQVMHDITRVELRELIKLKQRGMFRGSSTKLYVPAFTWKNVHYLHLGTPQRK